MFRQLQERNIAIQAAAVFEENKILKEYIKEQEQKINQLTERNKELELDNIEDNDFSQITADMLYEASYQAAATVNVEEKKCTCIML